MNEPQSPPDALAPATTEAAPPAPPTPPPPPAGTTRTAAAPAEPAAPQTPPEPSQPIAQAIGDDGKVEVDNDTVGKAWDAIRRLIPEVNWDEFSNSGRAGPIIQDLVRFWMTGNVRLRDVVIDELKLNAARYALKAQKTIKYKALSPARFSRRVSCCWRRR